MTISNVIDQMIKIAVIGLGTMGRGIAQVAAMNGCEVLVYDSMDQMIEKSKIELEKNLQLLVDKSKIKPEQVQTILSKYHWCNQLKLIW